ncbi:MAG TPA: UbiA family prenyltransferase [Tepidisphaeraceae bacterium]
MYWLSQRLLTLLQFTRMALVFTAVSDGWAALLLGAAATGTPVRWPVAAAMTLVSIGLYTFGMALNDLIDRRRDSQLAAHRPLPSGRLSVQGAHALCAVLGGVALLGGAAMAYLRPDEWQGLLAIGATLVLIVFYDFAGKYLVAPGLLALGLIRFAHASVPWPHLPIPWQAVTLLLHVAILSTVCYGLEGKRPRLRKRHVAFVVGGLLAVTAAVEAALLWRQGFPADRAAALRIGMPLVYPAAVALAFVLFAAILRARQPDARAYGRQLMLYGLLWLIAYDAAFVFGYVGWKPALAVLALLPIALLCVQLMRAWAALIDLSQSPQYQRAR